MRGQRGVALITALLVVALAATAAADMVYRQQLDIRRSQNVLARDQAYLYALAAESFAKDILLQDLQPGSAEADHLGEFWAREDLQTPYGRANIRIEITDLQGRINLNNLLQNGEPSEAHMQRFRGLLDEVNGLSDELSIPLNGTYTSLDRAIVDWIDDDVEPQFPGGAEDDLYTRDQLGFRPPNQPMRDASELRLILGLHVGEEQADRAYRALRDYVATLPPGTTLNVNTAPAPVLAALPKIDYETAKAVAESDREYEDVQAFLNDFQDFDQEGINPDLLGVTSDYFHMHAIVQLDRAMFELYSVIHRQRGGGQGQSTRLSVIKRAFGDY